MSNQNKLNWDNFSETEQNAIAIACQNVLDGTNEPTFPSCDVAFDALRDLLADITITEPELLRRFSSELHCITKVLLEIAPITKNPKNLSDEQVQKALLQDVVISFVVGQFHQIIAQCETLHQMAEMDLAGGKNESIH